MVVNLSFGDRNGKKNPHVTRYVKFIVPYFFVPVQAHRVGTWQFELVKRGKRPHSASTRETTLSFFDSQTVTYKGSMKSTWYLWSSLMGPVVS